jgi:hypothetical protein
MSKGTKIQIPQYPDKVWSIVETNSEGFETLYMLGDEFGDTIIVTSYLEMVEDLYHGYENLTEYMNWELRGEEN